MTTPIATVTLSPALDVELIVEELVPDAKLVAVDSRRDAGGGGVNVARVLRRLSLPVTAIVAVGGSIGAELVAMLTNEDVDVRELAQTHMTRESIAVRELTSGRQYRIAVPSPPLDDAAATTAAVLDAVRGIEIVVLSGGLPSGTPPSLYREIVDALPDAFTIVDTPRAELRAVAAGAPSLVKPSRRELAALVGWLPEDDEQIATAAHQVLGLGSVGAVVASLGPRGAVLARRDGSTVWFDAPSVEQISTVGAGDSMVAGIVAGLSRSDDLVESVRRGVAAGSAAVGTPGTELCWPRDVDRLLAHVEVDFSSPS